MTGVAPPAAPRRPGLLAAAGLLVLLAATGCGEALQQERGIVVSVDSPAFGQVDAFELLTPDGRTLRFDTSELAFRPEFPAPHLGEHQMLADPIVVTYRNEGERRIVTKLDDG